MAIFAIGAYYDGDVSKEFIKNNIIGPGWSRTEAPELFQYLATFKVGDIIYIKSCPPSSQSIHVKGIGFIISEELLDEKRLKENKLDHLVSVGRRVHWVNTERFEIPKPKEKNNVRLNTIYEEFHPAVQKMILDKILFT